MYIIWLWWRRNILSIRDVHVHLLCIDVMHVYLLWIDVTFTAITNEQHFHWLVICDKHDKTNISDSNNYLPLLPVTHKTNISDSNNYLPLLPVTHKTNISDSNNYLPLLPVTHKTSIYTHTHIVSHIYLHYYLLLIRNRSLTFFGGKKMQKCNNLIIIK